MSHFHFILYHYQSRCRVVYNITTSISFTKKGRISNFYIFSILPILPIFLTFYPKQIGNSWYLAFSNVTETVNFKIYILCLFSLENILPPVPLIIFSLIAKSKFNERMRKGLEAGMVPQTGSSGSRFRRDEIQFSRIIFFTMTVFITTRLIDLITGIIFVFNQSATYRTDAIIYFLRQVAALLLICAHAFNSVIYMGMNSKLRQILPFRATDQRLFAY